MSDTPKSDAAIVKFENDSSRSESKPMYELVPMEAVDAIAERMGMGFQIHGRENWKGGGPEFFAETKRHLVAHLLNYLRGDDAEDHLSAVITNAAMLCWWERTAKARWIAKTPE